MSQNKIVIKLKEIIDKQFHSIFNNSHFFYTIVFIISLVLISLIGLIPNAGNIIIFIATVISITFLLLMVESLIPALDKFLFSIEKKVDRNKGVFFLINIIISSIIVIIYFVSSTDIVLEFLRWDVILPVAFIVIYFGWNMIQILYLKTGFEEIAVNVDEKIAEKYGTSKKREANCFILLVAAIVIPILIQLGILFGYLFSDPSSFNPQLVGTTTANMIIFIVYNIFIFFLILVTAWRLITLYFRSKKNETVNAFSPIFYLLIWLITIFRSYSLINTIQNITKPSATVDIPARIIDIILMIVTTVIVLRGVGGKVSDSIIFNKNTTPFFLYAFTTLYFVGQIVLVTGAGSIPAIFSNSNQISLINSFLIIMISVVFYWFYSESILDKKGLIIKRHFFVEDVVLIIKDFQQTLEEKDALNPNKFGDADLDNFLALHHLELPEPEPEIETKPEPEVEPKPELVPKSEMKPEPDDISDNTKNLE